tara:strand:+ start:64 stop:498 length:435 start_codon:yes stop_codon:yes gene_type:complete
MAIIQFISKYIRSINISLIKQKIILISLIKLVMIIILITSPNFANAYSNEWVEVPSSEYGRQYWDKLTIKYIQDKIVRVTTKFIPFKTAEKKEFIYETDIDCSKNLYKDISINGIKELGAEWLGSNQDKLIEGLINQVCTSEIK